MNDLLNSLVDRTVADGIHIRPRLPSFYEPALGQSESATGLADAFSRNGSLEVLFEREAPKFGLRERLASARSLESKIESPIPELNHQQDHRPSRLDQVSQTARMSFSSPVQSHSPTQAQETKAPLPEAPASQPEIKTISIFDRPEIVERIEVKEQTVRTDGHTPIEDRDSNPAQSLQPRVKSMPGSSLRSVSPLLKPLHETQALEKPAPFSSTTESESPDLKPVGPRKGRQLEVRVLETPSPPETRTIFEALASKQVSARPSAVLSNPNHEPATLPIVRPRVNSEFEMPTLLLPEPPRPVAEQVVNVTIGRLEVRAAPASGVTQLFRAQTKPQTSLEEYLRPRNNSDRGGSV